MKYAKWLCLVVFSVVMVLGFGTLSLGQEVFTITSWSWDEPFMGPYWDTIQADFEKAYPDIKFERHEIAHGQYWNQILILVSTGPSPDVINCTASKTMEFMLMDGIEALDDWMDLTEVKKTFMKQQVTFPVADGKIYALVQGARTLQLLINEKMLEEAGLPGPPTTPEEFVAYAIKMTDPVKGKYGAALKGSEQEYEDTYDCVVQFIVGYGGNFSKDGVPTANSPEAIQGVKLFKLITDMGLTPVGGTDKIVRQTWISGNAAMTFDGPWNFSQAEAAYPEVYPHLNAVNTPFANKAAIGGANHFFVIPRLAKNKSAAGKFIEFSTKKKYQELYSDTMGVIPGNPDFASRKKTEGTKWFQGFVEGARYGVQPMPPGFEGYVSEFTNIVIRHVIGAIILQGKPVEEIMDKCQEALVKFAKEI